MWRFSIIYFTSLSCGALREFHAWGRWVRVPVAASQTLCAARARPLRQVSPVVLEPFLAVGPRGPLGKVAADNHRRFRGTSACGQLLPGVSPRSAVFVQ